MKPRHHLYLDDELTAQLEALLAAPGSSRSAIVSDALRHYLRHEDGTDQDEALKSRLDRLSRRHERLERDIGILLETLKQFVCDYLLFTIHLPEPEPDTAACVKMRERYQTFIDDVGQNLAGDSAPSATAVQGQARSQASGNESREG